MQSRRFVTVVTLLIVVAFVVVAVAPAFAAAPAAPAPAAAPAALVLHARLASSTPEDGASVKTAREVVLTFNEDVNPDFVAVRVKGPDGSETAGSPSVDGPTVTQPLGAALPAGEHTVTYRVVSADGHPVAGTVTFTTTQAAASASPSTSPSASPVPSSTASVVASPAPSPTADPTSADTGEGLTPWLVVAAVAVLAALGLGAAWRTVGGPRADADTDSAAADDHDDERVGPTA